MSTAPSPQPQISYQIAYYILPQHAFHLRGLLLDMFRTAQDAIGSYLYELAREEEKLPLVASYALQIHARTGPLDDTRDYFVIEFPEPLPIDLTGVDMERLPPGAMPVLAPFFSALIIHRSTGEAQYYVLGQAPLGGTTLRMVTANGRNTNLGRGPEPSMEAFLDVLRNRSEGQ